MENLTTNQPPRWYKTVLALWGPLSLVGGVAVAYAILDSAPSSTVWIGSVANVVQVVLLGLLIQKGLQYYTAKQLAKRFLIALLLIAVVPIIFIVIDTGGEMSLGVLMLLVLSAVAVPQLLYAGLYGLARKIFKSSTYLALVVSAVIHDGLFMWLFQFFGE